MPSTIIDSIIFGDIFSAADVIPQREIRNVVIERVGGEIATPDIVINIAVDVVTQDAAVRVEHALGVGFFVEAVTTAVAAATLARIAIRPSGAAG